MSEGDGASTRVPPPWIGEVPEGWQIVPLRHLVHCLDGQRVPLNAEQRAARPGVTPYWGASAIMDFVEGTLFDEELVLLGEDGAPFFDRTRQVAFRSSGPVWPNNHVHVLRPVDGDAADFIAYALNGTDFAEFVDGSTRDKLTQSAMNRIPLPWPPNTERLEIVAFLDRETTKIDALVKKQRRLIELLKEKRQSIISHAITKGLDPTAKMKPSGIEWLGDVPAHWDTARGRTLFRKVDLPPLSADGVVTAFRDGQVTLRERRRTEGYTMADLEVGYQHVRDGDLVINGMDAFAGAIGVSEADGKCSPEYTVLAPVRDKADNQYYALALRLMALRNFVYVICPSVRERAPRFRFETFKDVLLPLPPLPEQHRIVSTVASIAIETDSLVREAEKLIMLLGERRFALVSAAVTGKINVRGHETAQRDMSVPVLVAAEAIERLSGQRTFGRVKLHKIIYLAEAHAYISEIGGSYLREAAGPLDRDLIEAIEADLIRGGHSAVGQEEGVGSPVTYKLLRPKGESRDALVTALGKRAVILDNIIDAVADLDTKGTEAVATLYAVWNDFLLSGTAPTDEEVVSGVLNDWHPEKPAKFRAADLHTWLGWMRRHALVPSGRGPRTTTGRLFP